VISTFGSTTGYHIFGCPSCTTATWNISAQTGIIRDDPSTWTKTRPEHLQHLKGDPAFSAVGSERTIGAIQQVLDGQALPMPKNWGAFFLHFPTGGEWDVPSAGWHMDGDYTGELSPPCGVLIHAMLTDVAPRHGGTNILSGSHRLVRKWFAENPPAAGARGAQLRKSLQRHPYVRDLCTAGDLILMHTLLLHAVPTAHLGSQPRFLLSTGVQQPYW
jgi:Phytanoyl-CoA dioxygenase (PhyH)